MKGLPLSKAFAEINRARRSLVALRAAKLFSVAEAAWLDGVASVERAWDKAGAEFWKVDGFTGWNSKYVGQRRSDPLLQYVHNARHAAEHTIEDTVGLNNGYLKVDPVVKGGETYVERLEIRKNGEMSLELGNVPVKVEIRGSHLGLRSFVNRGTTYNPPLQHLEKNFCNEARRRCWNVP